MRGDNLHEPLGLDSDRDGKIGRDIPWNTVGLCGLAALAAGLYGFARWSDNGMGGEPFAVARVELPAKPAAPVAATAASASASPEDATGTIKIITAHPRDNAAEVEARSGVKVVRSDGSLPPGGMIIQIPSKSTVELTAAPDRRLVEKGKYGQLPKVGADGSRPLDVYARPVVTPLGLSTRAPRLALVVGGMGLSRDATRQAIDRLPPETTLAFAPYGSDLPAQAARARSEGHEIVLQLPMEGPAGAEPAGPRALEPGLATDQLMDRLEWLMSRFTGYVGFENFLGRRFTAQADSLGVVLKQAAARGLMYLDDGVSSLSVAASLGPSLGATVARADVVVDADRSPSAVKAALARLEALARDKGVAIGVMSALPAVVDEAATFLAGLGDRGVALEPLSALAAHPAVPTAGLKRYIPGGTAGKPPCRPSPTAPASASC